MSERNLCKICFKFKTKIMDNLTPLVLQCHNHPQTRYHSVILVQTMDFVNVIILSQAVNVLHNSKFSHESPAVVFSLQTPSFLSSSIQLSHYSNWDTWFIRGVNINSQALEATIGGHAVWCPKCQILPSLFSPHLHSSTLQNHTVHLILAQKASDKLVAAMTVRSHGPK
jgi:hypothetical protein